MSDIIEIEMGKDGLEVEASGTVLAFVAGLTFTGGLILGLIVGFKIGKEIGKRD